MGLTLEEVETKGRERDWKEKNQEEGKRRGNKSPLEFFYMEFSFSWVSPVAPGHLGCHLYMFLLWSP
jgi:hypothetical protein